MTSKTSSYDVPIGRFISLVNMGLVHRIDLVNVQPFELTFPS